MMFRRLISNRDGAAAAEMALLLPIAILLMFTALEAGHYMYQRHQVVKGLRDGARFAARQDMADMDCTSGPSSGVVTATQNLTSTGVLSGGSPRVANWTAGSVTVTVDCTNVSSTVNETGIYDSTRVGRKVIVSTSFTYNSLFGGLGIVDNSFKLGGVQQATVMGI